MALIEDFYNHLAPYYKWLHGDWEESTFRHATVLDGVIHEFFGSSVHTILDATCGRRIYPRDVRETDTGRIILFDVWEFDDDYYDLTMYIVEDDGKPTVQTHAIRGGRYYCVSIDTLERLFTLAGFTRVMTVRDRFFQPLIIAMKE